MVFRLRLQPFPTEQGYPHGGSAKGVQKLRKKFLPRPPAFGGYPDLVTVPDYTKFELTFFNPVTDTYKAMAGENTNNVVERPRRSQSFMLRTTLGIVFLFLGITQFAPSQHEAMPTLFELGLPFLKNWIGFQAFSILFGGFEIFFAFWLFSGRLIRAAGLVALMLGAISFSFLFTLKEFAWDKFPFLLSPRFGQMLIKDFLFVGIGFFMLFEKRVAS
ncbi:MAG: hypothetical protein HY587_05175 [Candidatus Omnitrophica bacterium]|nr:hypothetical protein [Candidatus Omnitrophota bacterium]